MVERGDPVLSVAAMVAAEQAVFDSGISVDALMLRAGQGAGEMIWRIGGNTPTLVLCGPGNNGGDGYVIAEYLSRKGVAVTVAALGEPRTDAARNARAQFDGPVIALSDAVPHPQVVDCLFGSGLARPIDPAVWTMFVQLVSDARRSFAIDVPSGADANRAIWLNAPLRFDHVLALGAWKYAHLLEPGASDCGAISLIDIGIPAPQDAATRLSRPTFSPLDAQSHKYRRGLVAVIVGKMPGAALLAALAAQGTGAGYVKLIGAGQAPGALPPDLVWERADDPAAVALALADPRIGAVLVGPGLGREDNAAALLDAALACAHPLVIDADALHLLMGRNHDIAARTAPVLLTPHQGEFEALAKAFELGSVQANKAAATSALAAASGTYMLHKGADSVIASPSGQVVIADRRCGWLSVAGTGDVLGGCVAARLASHHDPLAALTEAAWLHDRAARLAGPAFSARTLAAFLPRAVEACLER